MALARLCPLLDNEEIDLEVWRKWYNKVYCKRIHFIEEVKKPCLEYFDYKCFCCGKKAKTAHHSKTGYSYLWYEEIPKHVIAVCNGCHALLHDKILPPVRKQKTVNSTIVVHNIDKLKEMSRIDRKLPIDININSVQNVSILEQSVSNLNKKKEKIDIINVG